MVTVLLISQDSSDRVFAEAATAQSGFTLRTLAGSSHLAEELQRATGPVILFADVSTPASLQETCAAVAGKVDPKRVHFITSEDLGEGQALADSPVFGHLIVRRYGDPVEAGQRYGRVLRTLHLENRPSLESLTSSGTAIEALSLTHSSAKNELLDSIVRRLESEMGFTSRIANRVVTALDELLMNAIYDAPARNAGQYALDPVSRDVSKELKGRDAVTIRYAIDSDSIAFSVSDQYGSVNRLKLFRHILRSFKNPVYDVTGDGVSAGIGLALVFHAGGSFVFNCEPGVRTEVTVFFKRMVKFTEFQHQFRFISVHLPSPGA